MALVFFNIGWMKHYNGIDGDSIDRGGKYNQHSIGHEVCNFTNNKDMLYGYVQPVGDVIKIEKLGASTSDRKVDGVTVVWTAGPASGGTVVIGWYRNATVYRDIRKIKEPNALQKKNNVSSYRVSAAVHDAVLLPVERRELIIPRAIKGGIGQSNVWFADKEESKDLVSRVWALIEGREMEPLPDIDQSDSMLEGNPRLVAHLRRERSSALVKKKKQAVLKSTGKLCCEVCKFDFKKVYGELGEQFCEVHHLRRLSQSDGKTRTELKDLAIICSNCHRIIHRTEPMLTIEGLAQRMKSVRDAGGR